jgi:apolipoprotein N-acyltransferase
MRHTTSDSISAGLVILDEKRHDASDHPDFQKEIQLVQDYSNEIEHLATQGAKIVVLPERAININNEIKDTVIGMLRELAVRNKVAIVTGYTNFTGTHERNSALVISAEGEIADDYDKCHLVTGLEDQFTRGDQAGLFKNGNTFNGVAICKDLDYPSYIRTYGKEKINLLYIPAWDFVTDDWLHSRMAVLRGVENGFSEIRAARQGRLTISDYYGRVNYEANASCGAKTILLGKVDAVRLPTLYSKWGNWFGILNLAAAVCFIFLGFKRNPARQ